MIRGAGRYSTLITPTAGSLFHAEFQSAMRFSNKSSNSATLIMLRTASTGRDGHEA